MSRGHVVVGLLVVAAVAAACGPATTPGAHSVGGAHPSRSNGATPLPARPVHHRIVHHRTTHHGTVRSTTNPSVAGVPAVDVPDHRLTPGVSLPVSTARVCVPGYASSVRDVSDSEKRAVYARYGIPWVPYQHEVDHLISLELGGSNDIHNLWPEPYAGRWGARTKDAVENRLHDLVCAGRLSLASAQRQEAANWVAAYRRYVGAPPSGQGGGSATSSSGGYYASSYSTASTIYCADDPTWRDLSKTYLVHFDTLAQASARFPSYHLHQPC